MSTTNLFIEILISGIQGSIWLVLLATGILGFDWFFFSLFQFERWSTLVTLLIIAFWYTLGIIVEGLSYGLFRFLNPQIILKKFKWLNEKSRILTDDTRLVKILVKHGKIVETLDYSRTRVRILRSTILNIILITGSGLVFIIRRCSELGCVSQQSSLILITLSVGLFLVVLTLIILAMVEFVYDVRLIQAEREYSRPRKKSQLQSR